MRSDITPAMQDAFESGEFKAHFLIAIDFSTPIYLTDCSHAIDVGINRYLPVKGAMKIPNLSSSMQDEKGTITITLPNTDRVFDEIIEFDGFVDKWVNIGCFYWDKDGASLGAVELWSGKTTKPVTNETDVKISAASHHSIFEKTAGIRTTQASHGTMFESASEREVNVTFLWAGTAHAFKVGG